MLHGKSDVESHSLSLTYLNRKISEMSSRVFCVLVLVSEAFDVIRLNDERHERRVMFRFKESNRLQLMFSNVFLKHNDLMTIRF